MTPITHAVIDSDGDVLDTFGMYTQAVEAAINDAHRVVPLYDITCLDLIGTLMWNNHKQVWEARARGSDVWHSARLLREAVGLALAKPVVEEGALW